MSDPSENKTRTRKVATISFGYKGSDTESENLKKSTRPMSEFKWKTEAVALTILFIL